MFARTVPGKAAARSVRAHTVRVRGIVGVGGRGVFIREGRHGSEAGSDERRSTQLNGPGVPDGLRVVIIRVVAAGAGHLLRGREVDVREQLLADLGLHAQSGTDWACARVIAKKKLPLRAPRARHQNCLNT